MRLFSAHRPHAKPFLHLGVQCLDLQVHILAVLGFVAANDYIRVEKDKNMYKYKEVKENTFVLSLDNHVEVAQALAAFCEEKNILAGIVSGLGAISEATFRFLDPATKLYVDKTFSEQMEITNLTGNISQKDGKVYLHLHITASRRDYSCVGGHLLSARINGACELVVKSFPNQYVGRIQDAETGLNLYQF